MVISNKTKVSLTEVVAEINEACIKEEKVILPEKLDLFVDDITSSKQQTSDLLIDQFIEKVLIAQKNYDGNVAELNKITNATKTAIKLLDRKQSGFDIVKIRAELNKFNKNNNKN